MRNKSEFNQNSNVIKDINLKKNEKKIIIKNNLKKTDVIEKTNNSQEFVVEVKQNQTFSENIRK